MHILIQFESSGGTKKKKPDHYVLLKVMKERAVTLCPLLYQLSDPSGSFEQKTACGLKEGKKEALMIFQCLRWSST